MRRSRRLSPSAAALLAGVSASLAWPAGNAGATTPQEREHALVLQLYALDARVDSARRALASLAAGAAELGRERAALAARLAAANRTLARARRLLAAELRGLYEESQPDALAVFLAAGSLQDAFDGVDDLARASAATQSVVAQARAAGVEARLLARELARRGRDLRRARLGAAAELASLERTRAERASFLAALRERDRLEVEQRARAAAARARAAEVRATVEQSVASFAARAPAAAAQPAVSGARTLVVVSTGYSLPGTTASGLPVGHGVVAVDPNVIPLGTRLTIPGYGDAVAADTGPAITGARIDIWFPTEQQALAWGWRTLTVTLR